MDNPKPAQSRKLEARFSVVLETQSNSGFPLSLNDSYTIQKIWKFLVRNTLRKLQKLLLWKILGCLKINLKHECRNKKSLLAIKLLVALNHSTILFSMQSTKCSMHLRQRDKNIENIKKCNVHKFNGTYNLHLTGCFTFP